MKISDLNSSSARYRRNIFDSERKSFLVSRLSGTDQEKDLSVPVNCNGFGRIRHFKRNSNNQWTQDPLPMDPACFKLEYPPTDTIRAQVFQIAACNFRCWYCFVPHELLESNIRYADWITSSALLDLFLSQENPPPVIDISGGQPDLVPEWLLSIMIELKTRGLDEKFYLWSDDNLSTDYFWSCLSDSDRETIATYRNYGRVCCFKGFDPQSFSFNTGVEASFYENQFELFKRFLDLNIDLFAYVTLTSPVPITKDHMKRFVDKLQAINSYLPLRTVPLEIISYTPVKKRLFSIHEEALKHQYKAIEFWNEELRNRFSDGERNQNIAEIKITQR